MEVKVLSSNGESEYIVDTEKVTCTCANFKYRCSHFTADREERICKHINQVFTEHPEWKPISLVKAEKEMDMGGKDSDGKVRYPRGVFDLYVADIKSALNQFIKSGKLSKFEICGSYRRLAEKVSDLDILMDCNEDDWNSILEYFENILGYSLITEIGKGDRKAAYLVDGFVHVDFKRIEDASWPFALMHFTGSKYTNINLRRKANKMGYKLNEYGLFSVDTEEPLNMNLKTEEDVYKFLQEPYKYPWER